MTNKPPDPDDITRSWVDQLAQLEAAVRAGASLPGTSDPRLAGASELLAQLQQLHEQDRLGTVLRALGLRDQIGRYVIRRVLGSGGFSVVYHAEDVQLQRHVALKIPLPPCLLHPEASARFMQEARTVAKLDHPHIVAAYEAGADGLAPFIAYAYCDGPTLAEWIKSNGPISPALAAAITVRLAEAVAYSHQQGVYHRDIKPANVLLFPTFQADQDGLPFWPRLTDFGLAKVKESAVAMTGSSVLLGTPLYMAPEQLSGHAGEDAAAIDVYGLGGVLYEMLTGQPPYNGDSVLKVLEAVRQGELRPVLKLQPEAPVALAIICEQALAARPTDRYADPQSLRDDLARYLSGERIMARPVQRWKRVARSLMDPQRIPEAATFVFLTHALLLAWLLSFPLLTLFHSPITSEYRLADLMLYSGPLALLHAACLFLAWKVYRKTSWATVGLMLTGLSLTVYVFLVLGRFVHPPYPEIYGPQRTRDIVFMLLLLLFALQTGLCLMAYAALRPPRRSHRKPPLEAARMSGSQ